MSTQQGTYISNVTIDGYDSEEFRFVYAKITEQCGGVLPNMVARYVASMGAIPTENTEVTVNIRIKGGYTCSAQAFIHTIEFAQNTVKLSMVFCPVDSLKVRRVNKFQSMDEAINSLYWGDIISSVEDTTPVTIHQARQTDEQLLRKLSYCMKSPSLPFFTISHLRLKNTASREVDVVIGSEGVDVGQYNILGENHNVSDSLPKYEEVEVYEVDGDYTQTDISNIFFMKYKMAVHSTGMDLVRNLVENTKDVFNYKMSMQVEFKYYPTFGPGDYISISFPETECTEWLVLDRVTDIRETVTTSMNLIALNELS